MIFLKRNLPRWERTARIVTGLAIGAAAFAGFVPAGIVMYLAIATAATLVLTAGVGFCPACAMLGRRSQEE